MSSRMIPCRSGGQEYESNGFANSGKALSFNKSALEANLPLPIA